MSKKISWHDIKCPECCEYVIVERNDVYPFNLSEPELRDCFDHMEEYDIIEAARKLQEKNAKQASRIRELEHELATLKKDMVEGLGKLEQLIEEARAK